MTAFAEVVAASDAVAATRSRSEKIAVLASLLRRLTRDEVVVAVLFLAGRARRESLGIGPAIAYRAAETGAPAAHPTLSLAGVAAAIAALRTPSGAGSKAERAKRLSDLFAHATAEERSFLVRWLVGELRQGALEGILIEAVASAASVDAAALRDALMAEGDLGVVAEQALHGGAAALAEHSIRLFHPVLPMLAATAKSPDEALARLGEAAVETKLDGVRVQVHKSGDRIEVYSRKCKRLTDAVAEVVAAAGRVTAETVILDGEAIALGRDGRPEPFQDTMRRFGRKLVDETRRETPLVVRFFDCLVLGDESLVARPQHERWQRLSEIVPPELRIDAIRVTNRAHLDAFVRRALDDGHEGVLLKSPQSPYRAGRRGTEWFKWKPALTLDLVVLAVEWGHGRRRGRLSNLHLGARDPASGMFVMIGKTFKGLTDEMLAWQTERFLALERRRDEWTVYVEPSVVVEIAFDGVQRSPHYPGGVALRFARVKRYRSDKSPEEADTIELVQSLLPGERKRSV